MVSPAVSIGARIRRFVGAATLIATIPLGAQTVMVSNLGETAAGTSSFSSTQSLAASFTTGSAATTLTGITLSLGSSGGSSTAVFSVALYTNNSGVPGSLITTLSGSSGLVSAGNYTYTPGTTINLSPATTYFWVGTLATSDTSARRRSYITSSDNETGSSGWSIGDSNLVKSGSGSWSTDTYVSQFSVSASAIPEPSTYAACAGAAVLGLAVWRRRRAA